MNQNTNPSTNTPDRSPYGFGFTGTTCRGAVVAHNHDIPADAVLLMTTISFELASTPVKTEQANNGMMIRRFGQINYWPATGQMHITQWDGALRSEIGSLFATAEHPKQDPATWPVHPCHPERRRISLYRPVDEHYLAEAAEIMFDDLEYTEELELLASWAEGLTNA